MAERRLLVLASKAFGLAPSQRFRLEQWAPHLLKEHKIRLDFAPFESARLSQLLYQPGHVQRKALWMLRDFILRAAVVPKSRSYDALVIHREASLIGPAFYETLIALLGKPIIYDFDDAIWSSDQLTINGAFSRLHFFRKTSRICKLASAVTVGNDHLANYAGKRNAFVTVVPSSIELADYPEIPEPVNEEKFIVSWTGSTSTLAHFECARTALERLAARVPLIVKVISSRPPDQPVAGAQNHFVPWSAKSEAQDVADCHVGIMPLPDNEATRGKGGMKALQYMATGRPVIVSPVGWNTKLVRHGHNGYLAQNEEEWVAALLKLQSSAQLRSLLGRNARGCVKDDYTAEISASKFAAVVDRLLP